MVKTLEKSETNESWMSRCRAVYKRNRQRKMQLGNRAKMQAREERGAVARREAKDTRKCGKGENRTCLHLW